jgi:hypothetical protein
MFLIQDLLRLDQFPIEAVERKLGRQHRVLHLEEAIIAGGEIARLRDPGFRSRVKEC